MDGTVDTLLIELLMSPPLPPSDQCCSDPVWKPDEFPELQVNINFIEGRREEKNLCDLVGVFNEGTEWRNMYEFFIWLNKFVHDSKISYKELFFNLKN